MLNDKMKNKHLRIMCKIQDIKTSQTKEKFLEQIHRQIGQHPDVETSKSQQRRP